MKITATTINIIRIATPWTCKLAMTSSPLSIWRHLLPGCHLKNPLAPLPFSVLKSRWSLHCFTLSFLSNLNDSYPLATCRLCSNHGSNIYDGDNHIYFSLVSLHRLWCDNQDTGLLLHLQAFGLRQSPNQQLHIRRPTLPYNHHNWAPRPRRSHCTQVPKAHIRPS